MSDPPDDSPAHPPLDYATGDRLLDARRGIRKWILLLSIWLIGLLVWSIYLAAGIYLFFRFFA